MRLNNHADTSQDYKKARHLRNMTSPIEQKLWRKLRENAAARGLRFRRQQAIHPYMVDFAWLSARLLVELDGSTYDQTVAYDKARERHLREQDFCVLRFNNQEIIQNMDGVVEHILAQAEIRVLNFKNDTSGCPPTPNPAPRGGGEHSRLIINVIPLHQDNFEC